MDPGIGIVARILTHNRDTSFIGAIYFAYFIYINKKKGK